MKKWILAFSILFLAACGDKGQDNKGADNNTANVSNASTPLDSNCLQNNAYCDNTIYNQQQNWMAYPNSNYQSYQGNYTFCACPSGYMPAYNGTIGLGCVRKTRAPQTYYQWQFKWRSNQSGFRYDYNYSSSRRRSTRSHTQQNRNCYANIAQSCFIGQANGCQSGGQCQSTGTGSLGVCVTPGYHDQSRR